jgi:hypothetical protein
VSGISYRHLDDNGKELLERDVQERRVFLDFLAVLQDIVLLKSNGPDLPLFTEVEQSEKARQLSLALTDQAHIRDTALANREFAFQVKKTEARRFLTSLLDEYNEIRLFRQGARPKISFR